MRISFLSIIAAFSSSSSDMEIIEHLVRSKVGADLSTCEDGFVVSNDFALVVDGATSATGRRWTAEKITGGQWAARLLCQAILKLPAESSPQECVNFLSERMKAAYELEEGAIQSFMNTPEERATASMVLFSRHLKQMIFVGDCQAAFVDSNGKIAHRIQPEKYIDSVTARARCMFLQAELLAGTTIEELRTRDPGRELIQPLLVRQRRFQNNMDAPELYRYFAMDGFPIPSVGIEVHDVPADVKQIILASDGYPKLYPSLEGTESYLMDIVKEDPMLCIKFQSTKGVKPQQESFDDRTYIRIQL